MSGRDARTGPRAASQASPRLAGADDRERGSLKAQLAAWRERRDQRKPAAATSSPKPFRPSGSNGPSDADRQRILQRRREIMRPASRAVASPPLKPAKREIHAEETKPTQAPGTGTATVASASVENSPRREPRDSRIPPPRTPPPRETGASAAPRPVRVIRPPQLATTTSSDSSRASSEPATLPLTPPGQLHSSSPSVTSAPSPLKLPARTVPAVDQPPVSLPPLEESRLEAPSEAQPTSSPPTEGSTPLRSPAASPQGSETASSSSAGRRMHASPVRIKQVRFADDAYLAKTFDDEDKPDFASNNHDDGDDDESSDLADSQSSVERDIRKMEQILLEADELIHQETTVTDHIVRRHTGPERHKDFQEIVVETREKDSVISHRFELAPVTLDVSVATSTSTLVEAKDGFAFEDKDKESFRKDSDSTQSADSVDTEIREDTVHSSRLEITHTPDSIEDHRAINTAEDVGSSMDHGDQLSSAKASVAQLSCENAPESMPLQSDTQILMSTRAGSSERRKRVDGRTIFFVALSALVIALFTRLYPQSPISRSLRVATRIVAALSVSIIMRSGSWVCRSILLPFGAKLKGLREVVASSEGFKTVRRVVDASLQKVAMWNSSAKALDGVTGWTRPISDSSNSLIRSLRDALDAASTWFARIGVYLLKPFTKPLDGIDPSATQHRLQELADVPQQLQQKVNELLRSQEEWALEELKRMKDRRVAYAAATRLILAETSKVMLNTVQEAKLTAVEHIQEFTNQLTLELMASIQSELEQYKRLEANQMGKEAVHDANLKKTKLEEAARLEILRVEMAKRQATGVLDGEAETDRAKLFNDRLSVEVDVVEIVGTVEGLVEKSTGATTYSITKDLEESVDVVQVTAEVGEAVLDITIDLAQQAVKLAEDLVAAQLSEAIDIRKEKLVHDHDLVEAEIMYTTALEVQRLEEERAAAEQLTRSILEAEEAVVRAAEEGRTALDQELAATKKELVDELLISRQAAVQVEITEVEEALAEEFVAKKTIETRVVDEVAGLIKDVDEASSSIVKEAIDIDSELERLEGMAETLLDEVVANEAQKITSEQVAAKAELTAIADNAEQQIASSAGIQFPDIGAGQTWPPITPANPGSAEFRLVAKEAELRNMLLLSVGFVLLAVATGFALYPRWRRLLANPVVEAKRMPLSNRRRRRRSWQRPVDVSDSEPEEVTLLQTGSPSDDGLSDINEPEPEVVEQMNTPNDMRTSRTTTLTRSTYTSYTRTLDFSGEDAQTGDQNDDDRHDSFASPARTRRLRRRRG